MMAILENTLQAGRRPELEQVHYSEYLSRGFPLVQMLSRPPFLGSIRSSQVHQPEHSSKQDTYQNPTY
uniref:Uncharacterized protein n=1 Tax=Arundo donax TaxID=35708 RepID=A0A0A9C5A8_ARUDO